MSDLDPLFLYEANLSLYPTAADGTALLDCPIWWGAVANHLRLGMSLEEMRVAGSGDRYRTAHHIDEDHTIDIDRTWLLSKQNVADFIPTRNQQYVLVMVWESEGVWYQRTYYGVTALALSWDSRGTLHFGHGQRFRAQRFDQTGDFVPPLVYIPRSGGTGGAGVQPAGGGSPPPGGGTTPLANEEQTVGFFRENALVVGEYLLGHYRWDRDVKLNSARVIAYAPQGTPNVLTLEVDGLLQSSQLTIPVGTKNTEVTASLDLAGLPVAMGKAVRWKITAGPSPAQAAWVAALMMQVEPQ